MKLTIKILLLLICFLGEAQTTNTETVAKIKIKKVDDIISVIGTVTNTTGIYKSLTYSLLVVKVGGETKNVSKNKQEGRFTLEADETKELSVTEINSNEKDKITVLLLIYDDEKIIGKDRIVFNETKKDKKKETNQSKDDGIELRGIVIEETKTKPGRDFYEAFYNAYSFYNVNGNKIVGVYEKLSFGRSTIIQVKVEDVLIQEFLGKPDLEYLEEMAKIALRKVYKYFNDLKKQETNIKQY